MPRQLDSFFLGSKLDAQENYPSLECFSDDANRKGGEKDMLVPSLDACGKISIRKGVATHVAMLTWSEELRRRCKALNSAWIFVKRCYQRMARLQDLNKNSYDTILADYRLSETVMDQG